ncbi:thioredoxin [Coprobacillus sp. AM17-34]|nr:thioredoxin [Coprobacillus sp. AM17-34]
MGISLYKIKKWTKMMTGNSISHVDQGVGKVYSINEIKGYYNNLIEKVTKREDLGNKVPMSNVDTGEKIYFSIEIFQYGLGAYDLFLLNNDKKMLTKVKAAADWAVNNQQEDGSWRTFAYENPSHPYSSMAQGEGISLLLRAYLELEERKYLDTVKKAIKFMLLPIDKGGTTKYEGEDVYFYECTDDPLILNGWIFSLWGVVDYCKYFNDSEVKNILERTLKTLEQKLSDYDIGYWSMYEDGMRISSPFYHKLHIAQLNIMYELTGKDVYKTYADKFEKYQSNKIYKNIAFVRKAMQKIFKE